MTDYSDHGQNAADHVCPGSGHKWGSGTGIPICPTCKRGPRGLGVKPPILRMGKWTGRVPTHGMP